MNPTFQKRLALVLVGLAIVALLAAGFFALRLNVWIAKPKDKFSRFFEEDLQLLRKTGKLPKEWDQLRVVQIRSSGSIGQQLINGWKPSVAGKDSGRYKLDIFVTDAIDITARQYAAVVEFTITDLASGNNTISQFGRTFSLGYVL